MDALLTHGYFLDEDEAERRIMKPYPALGILSISAYLKKKGFDVKVFDTTFRTKQDFDDYIALHRPSVVGIYSNLMTKLNVLRQITVCKGQGCSVVVGGPDVPEYAEKYVAWGADAAVMGEGEMAMEELIPAFLAKTSLGAIPGIAYRKDDGSIARTPPRPLIANLDALPLPDRESIDVNLYIETWRRHHGRGSLSLICARGCPYTCTWCSRSVYGETHRRRSPENVVSEIEEILARYKPDMLWFADDVFTINHRWFSAFHEEMKRRNLRIPFECITRADRLTDEILGKMAELGSFRIWYGSESGSQRILDAMKRRVSVEEIRTVTKLARRHGIQTGLFVMLGYPGEEIEDIELTVKHLKETGADTFLTTTAYPIKGTEYFSEVEVRLTGPADWSGHTDRDLNYSGRNTKRFYWYANRYLVNEVRQHQLRRNGRKHFGTIASALVKSKLARLGMEFSKYSRT